MSDMVLDIVRRWRDFTTRSNGKCTKAVIVLREQESLLKWLISHPNIELTTEFFFMGLFDADKLLWGANLG